MGVLIFNYSMKKFLDKIHCPAWVVLILALVIILRIPSFFEPYYYGDEMIYLTLGEGIKKGLVLYSQIHDNKPPMIYLFAALAGNLFWFKALLAFWNVVTVIFFWHLSQALFPGKEKLHKAAVTIFALLTTLPLLEGNIVNSELFMIGTTIVGFLILLSQKLNFRNIFFAGVLFGVSTLFKVPAAFDIPAIVFYWLLQTNFEKGDLKIIVKRVLFLAIGFAIPLLLTFIYFALRGALPNYFVAAFMQNVGYLSSWRAAEVQKPFFIKNLPLIIRGVIMLLGLGSLYIYRKKLGRSFLFIVAWLLFGLFAVTLSERPYPHYLIQVVPEIALLLAVLFSQKSLEQSLAILPLTLAFLVPVYYKYWYYPTSTYYQRFISFVGHKTTKVQYLNGFGSKVSQNYEVADFIINSTKKDDKIFVWGEDAPIIYALTRHLPPTKYVATYHINDYSNQDREAKVLINDKPVFIVLLPNSSPFPQITSLLKKNYLLISNFGEVEVWKLRVLK